jgi:hypothetical protein
VSGSLEKQFPKLQTSPHAKTSPPTPNYNCIAWSAEDNRRWWWPDPQYYWPDGVKRERTIEAFIEMYSLFGYEVATDREIESQFEKIAIYVDGRAIPTHAARQLRSGMWTSKLGNGNDIAHELDALEGNVYGRVAVVMRRPRK